MARASGPDSLTHEQAAGRLGRSSTPRKHSAGLSGCRLCDGFPAPVDEVGDGWLAAGGLHQGRDLAAVMPGVPEELGKDVLDRAAEPPRIKALVLESLTD